MGNCMENDNRKELVNQAFRFLGNILITIAYFVPSSGTIGYLEGYDGEEYIWGFTLINLEENTTVLILDAPFHPFQYLFLIFGILGILVLIVDSFLIFQFFRNSSSKDTRSFQRGIKIVGSIILLLYILVYTGVGIKFFYGSWKLGSYLFWIGGGFHQLSSIISHMRLKRGKE